VAVVAYSPVAPRAHDSSSSLDPQETPVDPGPAFRHSGWQQIRSRVRAALIASGAKQATVASFDACGSNAWVYRRVSEGDADDLYTVKSDTCHHRFCLPCAIARSTTIAINLLDAVGGSPRELRFITLTLATDPSKSLSEQLTRLVACFRKLRSRPVWRRTQQGGVAFIEVKRNLEAGTWHPHLHVIAQGRFMPQKSLSQAWRQVTGDSYICDIRYVKSSSHVARYVTTYASKPFDFSLTRDHDALVEAMLALKGKRLILQFGTWRTLRLVTREPPDSPGAWTAFESLNSLYRRAARSETDAVELLRKLSDRGTSQCQSLIHPRDGP
jgi:hypothetical protein